VLLIPRLTPRAFMGSVSDGIPCFRSWEGSYKP
jgi:hypothetical protein